MRIRILLSCLCLVTVAAHSARAQNASDLYDRQRAAYLHNSEDVAIGSIQERQANYLQQIAGSPSFWWQVWQKHQPYSTNINYAFKRGVMDIPTDTNLTSNSIYGRNITELVYSKPKTPARSAAQVLNTPAEPSAAVLAAQKKYEQQHATGADVESRLNQASYPSEAPSTDPLSATRNTGQGVQQLLGR